MADDFDVVVIGAGPGGYVAAIRAAQLGLKTACVEKRDRLGGTCLNVGCIPSKSLLHASEFYEEAKGGHLTKFGITFGSVDLDLGAMMTEKDKAVKELTDGVAFLFKKNKVEWVHGEGSFVDAHSLKVGDRTLTAKNFIIATGSDVLLLPGMVPDGEVLVTSTEALALPKVPGHLVVIGGGYIGLEMGSVWRRLGAKVTVVEYAERIVPAMDAEVGTAFAKLMTKQGIELRTATKVIEARREGNGAVVVVEPANGRRARGDRRRRRPAVDRAQAEHGGAQPRGDRPSARRARAGADQPRLLDYGARHLGDRRRRRRPDARPQGRGRRHRRGREHRRP